MELLLSTAAQTCARIILTAHFSYSFQQLTISKVFSHVCASITKDRCDHPTLRQAISTWTCRGVRLAPRRANEGYTAEPAACARLVCQAYHSCPGRTTCRPQMPRLAHSRCPQSRTSLPSTTKTPRFRTPASVCQPGVTPTPTHVRQPKIDPSFHFCPPVSNVSRRSFIL